MFESGYLAPKNVEVCIKNIQLLDVKMKDYDKWHKTLNYSMLFNALLLVCISIMLKIGEFNV